MESEDKLSERQARGARANALLQDELVQEAFDKLENAYIEGWRNSVHTDEIGREKLFLAINLLGQVKKHLHKIVMDGHMAQSDLEHLVKMKKAKY